MTTPHGRLFKSTFSQPAHAIELFRSVLPPEVVQHIDFDTLQVEPESFIDEKLRACYSDLLFSVRLASQHAYLDLLCEHQSRSERSLGAACTAEPRRMWLTRRGCHTRDKTARAAVEGSG